MVDEQSIFCPSCGYDLRAATSNRCSECGLELDPVLLSRSGIAWAHRREIGRLRAFVKTIWQVVVDSRGIRYELAKPQELADGRSFSRVVAILLAMLMAGIFFVAVQNAGGFSELIPEIAAGDVYEIGTVRGYRAVWIGLFTDWAVPWFAGARVWGVLPVCLVMLAFYLARVTGTIFHVSSQPAVQQERVRTLAHYLGGPLLIVLLVLPLAVVVALIDNWLNWVTDRTLMRYEIAATLVCAILAIGTPLLVVVRSAQWAKRARHAQGVFVAWLAALELVGLWIAGTVVIVGVVPWCIGLIKIAISSVR